MLWLCMPVDTKARFATMRSEDFKQGGRHEAALCDARGEDDFKMGREQYYVDKTDLVKTLIDGHAAATLITRPVVLARCWP